jgi:carboxymethylenebutenolidase
MFENGRWVMRKVLVVTTMFLLAARGAVAADGYVERMSREHATDRPVASPAAQEAPAGKVSTAEVVYGEVEGAPMKGYLAVPEGSKGAPGVIVIHEWWGLNDNIRAMARRLAGEGYQALAVDLYEGEVTGDRREASALMKTAMARAGRLKENLRQAYAYLGREGKALRVGVVGWCFGGHWSLQTALILPGGIDAAVIYYGRLVTDPEELKVLDMPLLGIFGAEDRGIPVENVRAFEKALGDLGKDAEVHIYEGAEHAFANPSGTRYKEDAAADAWEKTTGFFRKHLGGTP